MVDGDALVGIVTVSDVAKMAAEARGWRQVFEVMTPARELEAISALDPLERALELVLRNGHPQLPVLEDGRPVGMIWREDVVRVLELASVETAEKDHWIGGTPCCYHIGSNHYNCTRHH